MSDTPKTTRVLPEVTWSVVVNDEWMCLVRAETSGAAIVMAGDVWREAFPDGEQHGGIRLVSVHRGDMRGKLRTVSDAERGGFMLATRPRGRSDAERGGFVSAPVHPMEDAERGGLVPATQRRSRPCARSATRCTGSAPAVGSLRLVLALGDGQAAALGI